MKKPLLSELTLREKIGQTVVLSPRVMAEVTDIDEYFKKNPYGGMWTAGHIKMDFVNLAGEPVSDDADFTNDIKIREFSEHVRNLLTDPFLSDMDAEKGCRSILPYFSDTPSNNGIAATGDVQAAYDIAKCIAGEMKLAGIRWDWGPVCDNASPLRAVSLTRGFSSDLELSKKMISAYVKGVQSENVVATLKHFPGTDKDEYRDTHFTEALLTQSLDEWWERQGCLFKAGIDAGVYSVMIDHGAFPACDDTKLGGRYTPSTLSRNVITELLKEKLGFKGVVITDAVGMGAMMATYASPEDYYAALYNAGNDVILGPEHKDFFDIVERAVISGKIPESRIDDACTRVLDMKEKLGMFDYDTFPVTENDRKTAKERTAETVRKYAPKSITWMARKNELVPVKREDIKKVQLVYIGYSAEVYKNLVCVKEEFERHGAVVEICENIQSAEHIRKIDEENDLIMYFAHIAPHSPYGGSTFLMEKATQFLNVLKFGKEKSICVGTGSPFVFYDWFSTCHNFLNVYAYDAETLKMLVRGIYGECEFEGKCPYDPNPLAPRL